MKPRWLLEATGASLIFLLPYFYPLIMPGHLSLFHHHFPMSNVIGGFLLDWLGLIVLGIVLLAVLARVFPITRRTAGAIIASFFIWRTVSIAVFLLSMWYDGQRDNLPLTRHVLLLEPIIKYWPKYAHPILAIIVIAFAVLATIKPRGSEAIVRAVRVALCGFAFCAFWMIPELLFIGFAVPGVPNFDHSSTASAQAEPISGNRIVWILFDELSYDLTFDHLPTGRQYPNFQRLRSQGTSFGNIEPLGSYTDRVIPSLLAGRKLDGVTSTLDGKSLNLDSKHIREVAYDPNPTLFGEAKMYGWNPGVVGWYNPYCRIFVNVLTTCSWVPAVHTMLLQELAGASESKSVLANSLALPRALIQRIFGQRKSTNVEYIEHDVEDYRSIMSGARDLIQNERIHFVFIHLPVPHPPGLYNRERHQFSDSGNYLDNLVLADDTLGTLMQEIERTFSGAKTTVIISSDHSWRVSLWRNDSGWTPEEEGLSREGIDPRPVFIVHFPGQRSGHDVFTSRPELIEHDVVESMLKGGIDSPSDLDLFLRSSGRKVESRH